MKFKYLVIIAIIFGVVINFKDFLSGTGRYAKGEVLYSSTSLNSEFNIVPGETYRAKVLNQIDGDTSKIVFVNEKNEPILSGTSKTSEYTVRILNVDTPEKKKPNTPVQPFGPEASEYAHKLLDGKIVNIEVSEKANPVDKYNILLGYIYIDGKMYEELIVSKGLAKVAYLYKPDTKYASKLNKVQAIAIKKKIGIWSIKGYAEQENGYNMAAIKGRK